MATEKRLVYASEVEEIFNYEVHAGSTDLFDAFDSAIQNATTVDAVEVVRCRNCTFWKRHTKVDKFYGACFRNRITKHENGYCDKGERRTDNERKAD